MDRPWRNALRLDFNRRFSPGRPDAPAIWRGAAKGPARGGQDRRYEHPQLTGAVRSHLPPDHQEHEGAKANLKNWSPEDAKEAIGHGIRAKRSKPRSISFDLLEVEAADASVQ